MHFFAKYVFASISSKQTCLQGFASDDIHKALAFLIKNAENDSFKMRQHYAPYNRSEESHRITDGVCSSRFGRGIFRLRSI